MKNIAYRIAPVLLILASCQNKPDYDAQGTFEATEITVSSESVGKILQLDLEEGDSIVKDRDYGLIDTVQLYLQTLELRKQQSATLNSRPDIAKQASSLRQQIAGVKINRDRVQRLLADGAATQKQLDDLNTQLASLEGQLAGLLSQMQSSIASLDDRASAVDIQLAAVQDKLNRCHIQSPIDGVVLTKYAEPGEVAAFGTPLFKVADLSHMYLRAYFTSDQLSQLRLGQKVRVEANYGGDNKKEYEGTITFIAEESEFTPKTIQTKDSRANLVYAVKIAVENDGLLKIGLSGNVYLQ